MITIGNIQLPDKPVFLAPMEDVTDPSFRYICKSYGVDVLYTEFVASEALIRDIRKTRRKLDIFPHERPVGIQIYGHLLDSMIESAKIINEVNPDFIDLNFGCPVKKIATRGAGAGLLKNIPLMVKMAEEIVKVVNRPVTVKTRLGWDERSKPIVEVAERLQDAGVAAIAIHGRTRVQMYKGQADWSLIGEVKNNPRMHIPIIGNGDITTPEEADVAFKKYGVDGVMIGRAAIGRPWIFKEVRHFLDHGKLLPPFSIDQRVQLAKEQLLKSVEWKGAPRGIFEMRRHFSNYFKGLPHFKETRLKLVTSLNVDEILHTLDRVSEQYADFEFDPSS